MIEFFEKYGVTINIICALIVQITIIYMYFVFSRFKREFEENNIYMYQMRKREKKELEEELIWNSMPLTFQVQDIRDRLRIIDNKCNTAFNNLKKFWVEDKEEK